MRKVGLVVLMLLYVNTLKAQWVQMPFPTSDDLNGIAFCNVDTGFVVAMNKIYRTMNGGQSWVVVATAPSPHSLFDISVPKFNRNGGVIYAVGGLLSFSFNPQTQDVRNIVMRSTDYGTSWTTTINGAGIGESRLEYVYALKDSISFVMGSCGPYISNNSFKKTTNGGQTWNAMSGAIAEIYGGNNIDFISDSIAYLGNIFKSVNQGDSWNNFAYVDASKISFVNERLGYAGRRNIQRTTNSGVTWIPLQFIEEGQDMLSVDSLTAYVVCDTGKIFKTINGQTFLVQTTPITNTLFKITSLGKDTLYVIGVSGTVLKTMNGGGHLSTSEPPKLANEFRLEQNYPNPFNPTTTIKFSIAQTSLVSLAVYDVLGREVQTLISERKPAGNYSVNFNATKLSSGAYFYRLTTNSFSQTRKMILIK